MATSSRAKQVLGLPCAHSAVNGAGLIFLCWGTSAGTVLSEGIRAAPADTTSCQQRLASGEFLSVVDLQEFGNAVCGRTSRVHQRMKRFRLDGDSGEWRRTGRRCHPQAIVLVLSTDTALDGRSQSVWHKAVGVSVTVSLAPSAWGTRGASRVSQVFYK